MRPPLDLTTLVDCGCKTRVYADGSGVEIDYCPKHRAAPDLLEACEFAVSLMDELGITGPTRNMINRTIDKAKGKS